MPWKIKLTLLFSFFSFPTFLLFFLLGKKKKKWKEDFFLLSACLFVFSVVQKLKLFKHGPELPVSLVLQLSIWAIVGSNFISCSLCVCEAFDSFEINFILWLKRNTKRGLCSVVIFVFALIDLARYTIQKAIRKVQVLFLFRFGPSFCLCY